MFIVCRPLVAGVTHRHSPANHIATFISSSIALVAPLAARRPSLPLTMLRT